MIRFVGLGFILMLAFGLFEQWPRRLPHWMARWVLQVLAVAATVPLATTAMWLASTPEGAPPFWKVEDRMGGFALLTGLAVLLSPWVALGALVRQREAVAQEQALALDLARSEMERQALDARLNLLQAQVAPHFLFNTLANIQALVEAGSPQAPSVLRSLIAYLRAAVPRLREPVTTLGQEFELVRAYLELMKMRMPDRLYFTLSLDETAVGLRCPPMTLLTLVENAVRHGIDRCEDGGNVAVIVRREGGRCRVEVRDSGAGLRAPGESLGTGLAALRERLHLLFGDAATLSLNAAGPGATSAVLDFPAREAAG